MWLAWYVLFAYLCLNLSKLCLEYCGLFFPHTVYSVYSSKYVCGIFCSAEVSTFAVVLQINCLPTWHLTATESRNIIYTVLRLRFFYQNTYCSLTHIDILNCVCLYLCCSANKLWLYHCITVELNTIQSNTRLCMVFSSTVMQWYGHNLLAWQHSSHMKKSANTCHRQ